MIRSVFATDEWVWSLTATRHRAAPSPARALGASRVRPRAPRGSRPSHPARSSRRRSAGSPARSREEPQRLVLGVDRAGGLEPRDRLQTTTHDTTMSNRSDALVGAAGMNARKRGLSHEITAGASTSVKTRSTVLGIVARPRSSRFAGPRVELVGGIEWSSGTGVELQPFARVRRTRRARSVR